MAMAITTYTGYYPVRPKFRDSITMAMAIKYTY
jgi:hypothetical protein